MSSTDSHRQLLSIFRAIRRAPPRNVSAVALTSGDDGDDDAQSILEWFIRLHAPVEHVVDGATSVRPAVALPTGGIDDAPTSTNESLTCSLRLDFASDSGSRMPLCFIISPRLTGEFIHSGALCLRAQGSSWSLSEDSVRLLIESLSATITPLLAEQRPVALAAGNYTRAEHQRGIAHIREAHPTYFRPRLALAAPPTAAAPASAPLPAAPQQLSPVDTIAIQPPVTLCRVSSLSELVHVFESAKFIDDCHAGHAFNISAVFLQEGNACASKGSAALWSSSSALTLRIPLVGPPSSSSRQRPVVTIEFDTSSGAASTSVVKVPRLTVLFDRSLRGAELPGSEEVFPDVCLCGLQLQGAFEAMGDAGSPRGAEDPVVYEGGRVRALRATTRPYAPGGRAVTIGGNARFAAKDSCFHGPMEVSGSALATLEDCKCYRDDGSTVSEPLLGVYDNANCILTSVAFDDDWSGGFVGHASTHASVRVANGASLDVDKTVVVCRSAEPSEGTEIECDHATLRISDSHVRKAGGGAGSFTLVKVLGDTAQCFARGARIHLDFIAHSAGSMCSGVKVELGASATFEQCAVEGDEASLNNASVFFAFSTIAEAVMRCTQCSAEKCTNGFTVNGSVAHLVSCRVKARQVAVYASHAGLCRLTNDPAQPGDANNKRGSYEGESLAVEVSSGATVVCDGQQLAAGWQIVRVAGAKSEAHLTQCGVTGRGIDAAGEGDQRSSGVHVQHDGRVVATDCQVRGCYFGVSVVGTTQRVEFVGCTVSECHNGYTLDNCAYAWVHGSCDLDCRHVGIFVLNGSTCVIDNGIIHDDDEDDHGGRVTHRRIVAGQYAVEVKSAVLRATDVTLKAGKETVRGDSGSQLQLTNCKITGGPSSGNRESCGVTILEGATAVLQDCDVAGGAFGIFAAKAARLRCDGCVVSDSTNGFTLDATVAATVTNCRADARHVGVFVLNGSHCTIVATDTTTAAEPLPLPTDGVSSPVTKPAVAISPGNPPPHIRGGACGVEVRGATVRCSALRIWGGTLAIRCDGVPEQPVAFEADHCEACCTLDDNGNKEGDTGREKRCVVQLSANSTATLTDCRFHDAYFGVAAVAGAKAECHRCDFQLCHNGVTVDASAVNLTDCDVRARHVGVFVLSRGTSNIVASQEGSSLMGRGIFGKMYGLEVRDSTVTCEGVSFGASQEVVRCEGGSTVARLSDCTIRPLPDNLREFANADRRRPAAGALLLGGAAASHHLTKCFFCDCDVAIAEPGTKGDTTSAECRYSGCRSESL